MIGLFKAKLAEETMERRGSNMILLVAFLGLSCLRISSSYFQRSMVVCVASVILRTVIICSVLAQALLACVMSVTCFNPF